jgi:hypothetical protein
MDLLREWTAQVRKIPAVMLGQPYGRITNPLSSRPVGSSIGTPGYAYTLNFTWYSQPKGQLAVQWVCDQPELFGFNGLRATQKQLVFRKPGNGNIWVRVTYADGTVYECPPVKVLCYIPTDPGNEGA